MTAAPDDASLAQRSRLFLRQQPMLLGFIRSFVYHPQDAEDLLQEVGVVVLTRRETPLSPAEFGPWCRGVARNLILHYRRSHARSRVTVSDALARAVEHAWTEADEERDEWERRRNALAECLGGVDGRSAELLTLRYVDGLTSDAIGERLRLSAAAVRMTLMRVRRALQRCLEQRLAPG